MRSYIVALCIVAVVACALANDVPNEIPTDLREALQNDVATLKVDVKEGVNPEKLRVDLETMRDDLMKLKENINADGAETNSRKKRSLGGATLFGANLIVDSLLVALGAITSQLL